MEILVTHRNQGPSIRRSLDSLTDQLAPSDRIVLVDANSSDGSFEIIEEYCVDSPVVMEFGDHLSRGEGRQRAFELSEDDLVAAHVDLDATYTPCLRAVVDFYRELRSEREPGVLLFHGGMIADRDVVAEAGGWRDLQVHEDKDLWMRAADHAPVYWLPVSVIDDHLNFEWESVRYRLRRRYMNYRDALRLGVDETDLAASVDHHLSGYERFRDRRLLTAARLRARPAELGGLHDVTFDPESHLLRELTFHTLVDSGALPVERLGVPDDLSTYVTDRSYPGMTSYATGSS
ncbi:MAG: glycosyltransferase family 2 protein [Haloplanus sp.]